jgi:hypothetical protein
MFSGTTNSQVQGVPVPVGYGRLRIGSKVISTCLKPQRMRGKDVRPYALDQDGFQPWYNLDNGSISYLPVNTTPWDYSHPYLIPPVP